MPSVVLDTSTLVGALLKQDSVPERALLLARGSRQICMPEPVEREIREVFGRPKFRLRVSPERIDTVLQIIFATASWVSVNITVRECRDPKDDIFLELALASRAVTIVSSDDDLLVMHPWRGVAIITPAAYVSAFSRS